MADAAEMLWVVLASVSGGDWMQQSSEWQEAAARWRDNYFAVLAAHRPEQEKPHVKTQRCSEFEITEAMIRYGGSFVSQLGRLMRLADPGNKRRLVTAFPELIEQYDELAAHRAPPTQEPTE